MLRISNVRLRKSARLPSSFMTRERAKRMNRVISPFHQQATAREDAVLSHLRNRNAIGRDQTISPKAAGQMYEKMAATENALRFSQYGKKQLMGLQGLGDDKPLELDSRDLTPQEALLSEDEYEHATNAAPVSSYSTLMSRKIMSGQSWPSLPKSYELRSKIVSELEHESNMSPSAIAFSERVLFHLNRNIKACPIGIREGIRFEELIISRVIASRRSSRIYIVWSTVTPAARHNMEPKLEKLNGWIANLIKFNMKTIPNIPLVMWVYDTGALPTRLPKDLQRELKNVYGSLKTSNADRVQYLKSMDSLSNRMKDVPWFMPYLWSKEKKMESKRAMGEDLRVVESRRSGGGSGNKPGYVS